EVTCRQQSRDNQTTDFSTGVWSTETRELVRSTVERIVIHHDGVELTLKSKEIDHAGTSINDDNQSKSPKTVRLALPLPVPARARRSSFPAIAERSRVASTRHSSSRSPAQGYGWAACGRVKSLTRTRSRNALGSATPAAQPRTLTVKRLLRGIPLFWADQR